VIFRLAFIASLTALGAVGAQTPMPTRGPAERPSAAVAVDLTARYVGILSGRVDASGFETAIAADLIQAGNRIIGSWTIATGSSGTVTGTVMGPSTFTFEVRSTRPCTSVLRGSGVIDDGGAILHGSYGGAGCEGLVTASFRANRELNVGASARWATFRVPRPTSR